ncbi:MAG: T9SS type A sorting domain-containing protein [FCB group bacterium]
MEKYFLLLVILVISSINIFAQWEKCPQQPTNDPGLFNFFIVGNDIYVGNDTGLFLSTDNGNNWKIIIINDTTINLINAIAISGNNIFVGTGRNGVFLSIDSGAKWTQVNKGLTNLEISTITINGNNLIVGTSNGLFFSTDKGENWTAIGMNGSPVYPIYSVEIYNNFIFAGTNNHVFFTINNGIIWDEIYYDYHIFSVNQIKLVGNYLFVGTNLELDMLTNIGGNWNNGVKELIKPENIFSIASKEKSIIVGCGNNVYLSNDSGITWRTINQGLNNNNGHKIACNDDYIFDGCSGGVYRAKLNDFNIISVSENQQIEKFSIFPNPVSDYLNLSFLNNNSSEIKIYNELGIPVFEKKVQDENNLKIDTREYPPGVYFCQINAGSYVETKKFLVVK